jgi:hypothetical protein
MTETQRFGIGARLAEKVVPCQTVTDDQKDRRRSARNDRPDMVEVAESLASVMPARLD